MSRPCNVFMLVHDRPIYNYMALDALCRATYHPHRLVVFHHPSGNPAVDQVLQAFLSRKVISEIIEIPGAAVSIVGLMEIAITRGLLDDEFFFWMEDDVVIEPDSRCWIDKMLDAFRADDQLAMVGSAIDPSDFIHPEELSAELGRKLTSAELQMIKANSPERHQRFENGRLPGEHQNPAGRLRGFRRAAISLEVVNNDRLMNAALLKQGWHTTTLENVRHRHMSLRVFYDYPDYYERREAHLRRNLR